MNVQGFLLVTKNSSIKFVKSEINPDSKVQVEGCEDSYLDSYIDTNHVGGRYILDKIRNN